MASDRLLSHPVLVLNKHFTAIEIVSARRAFSLLYRDSAEILHKEDGTYYHFSFFQWLEYIPLLLLHQKIDPFDTVKTPGHSIPIPKIIRLHHYDKIPIKRLKFTRKSILARDRYTCQYCGRHFSISKLSIDHLIPKSRGGKSTWSNLVTACSSCNTKKGGRLPEEAGMTLICFPSEPKLSLLCSTFTTPESGYSFWKDFLKETPQRVDKL